MLRQLSLESLEGDPAAVGRGGRRQRLARHAQLVAASAGAEQVAGRGQRVPRHRQLLLPGDGEILFMGDTQKASVRFFLFFDTPYPFVRKFCIENPQNCIIHLFNAQCLFTTTQLVRPICMTKKLSQEV